MDSDGTIEDAGLSESRRKLAESEAARVAAQPLLENADRIIAELRAERTTNNWAARVREAFQATRGAA